MKCKTCPEELTIIKPDGFSMRICERCRTGCEVKKASGQTCFPILTKTWCGNYDCGETCRCFSYKTKKVTCDACKAEAISHLELWELPFFADVLVCASCLNSCGGSLSKQSELGHKAMKLKEVKR